MKVSDAMTKDVITVSPETSLKDAAAVLAERGISGLPVVEGENVVGMISEADIVARATGVRESPSLLGALFAGRKGHEDVEATSVADAMSSPAVTIGPEQQVAEAARVMVEKRVNRLPVVEEGRLAGIVTRADLVRAFVRPDEELEREIREDAERTLWIDPEGLDITVENGVVTLAGEIELRSDAELLEKHVAAVPGVVAVRAELRWRLDKPRVPTGDPHVPHPPRDRW
jgi:CBS domain-containing protein